MQSPKIKMRSRHTDQDVIEEFFQKKEEDGKTYIILNSSADFSQVRAIVQELLEERERKGPGASLKIKSLSRPRYDITLD